MRKVSISVVILILSVLIFAQSGIAMDDLKISEKSALPIPPNLEKNSKPTGEGNNVKVIDWAGFKSAVSYTFDDGQPSNLEHYEALNNTGVNMTFYISSNVDFDGFKEGWTQAVKDGHEIGNHTVSHPYADLTDSSFKKPLDSPEAEIENCTEFIKNNFDQSEVWTIAAPYGDSNWAEYSKSRFFINRGVGGGTISPNDNSNPHNLPSYMVKKEETESDFVKKIESARDKGDWLVLLYHTITPTEHVWYAPVNISDVTGSIEHTKNLNDVWIDTVVDIGAYWRGQKAFNKSKIVENENEKVWKWELPDNFPENKYLRVKTDGEKLVQNGKELEWNSNGYYEISLDAEKLTLIK